MSNQDDFYSNQQSLKSIKSDGKLVGLIFFAGVIFGLIKCILFLLSKL